MIWLDYAAIAFLVFVVLGAVDYAQHIYTVAKRREAQDRKQLVQEALKHDESWRDV